MAKKSATLPREMNRNKLKVPVRQQLLMEAGYKCGNPTCRNVITLEVHHIEYVSDGGGDHPSNLLALCPYCHTMHHAGHIPVEAVRLWKGLLVALNQAFDPRGMELLLFLHTNNRQLWYSADGVLNFAGLIAAGLVVIRNTEMSHSIGDGAGKTKFTQTTHNLELTTRGTLLVEAWLSGNEKDYRNLISAGNTEVANSHA